MSRLPHRCQHLRRTLDCTPWQAPASSPPRHLAGVYETDGVWSTISGFAQAMRNLSSGAVEGCSTARRTAASPPPTCPRGFEGRTCSVEINECARGTAGCDPNAACVNTRGGATCRCHTGYAGDGRSCKPTAELAAVQARYETDGPGRLACSEGRGLPHPEGAPGFAYDVTGALARVADGGQQVGRGWCGWGERRWDV